jgi:hypothetical protein
MPISDREVVREGEGGLLPIVDDEGEFSFQTFLSAYSDEMYWDSSLRSIEASSRLVSLLFTGGSKAALLKETKKVVRVGVG